MTRIAYLTSQYPATSHTFIRREVEALRQAGVDIDTFSIRRPSSGEQEDPENLEAFQSTTYIQSQPAISILRALFTRSLRHPVRCLLTLKDALQHRVPGVSALLYSFVYCAEAIVLAAVLEKRKIGHVHNHFANASAIVGYLAARHLRIGFSMTLHGISEFDYPAGLLLKRKLAYARFVACASHFCRAQALRLMEPHAWPKTLVVRCGIDTSRFLPRQASLPAIRLRLLHVGRLSAEKGQSGLITVVHRLRRRGLDVELRIIGDGPLAAALKDQARALEVDPYCIFLGRQGEDGVIAELHEADAFVMSSFMEGLPVVLMEAMACQVAVVAPCVAGIPEVVRHGETGLLFAPGDWDGLEEQLHALLTDPDGRRRLAAQGHALALEQLDIRVAAHPLVGQFNKRAESS